MFRRRFITLIPDVFLPVPKGAGISVAFERAETHDVDGQLGEEFGDAVGRYIVHVLVSFVVDAPVGVFGLGNEDVLVVFVLLVEPAGEFVDEHEDGL